MRLVIKDLNIIQITPSFFCKVLPAFVVFLRSPFNQLLFPGVSLAKSVISDLGA